MQPVQVAGAKTLSTSRGIVNPQNGNKTNQITTKNHPGKTPINSYQPAKIEIAQTKGPDHSGPFASKPFRFYILAINSLNSIFYRHIMPSSY
jgi:hypothetical protein